MAEARTNDRARTFLKAVIEFNNGAAQIDCVVKNVSPTGARLQVANSVVLPSDFNVRIPHRGETLRGHLVWRDGDSVGIRFMGPAVQPTKETSAPGQKSSLELENARLAQRVRELTRRLEELGQDPNLTSSNGNY